MINSNEIVLNVSAFIKYKVKDSDEGIICFLGSRISFGMYR